MSSSGTVFWVPKGSASPYGEIKVVCVGDSISATAQTLDAAYSVTAKSTTNPKVDIVFTKGTVATEYAYTCSNGAPIGGQVVPERP